MEVFCKVTIIISGVHGGDVIFVVVIIYLLNDLRYNRKNIYHGKEREKLQQHIFMFYETSYNGMKYGTYIRYKASSCRYRKYESCI